MGDSVHLPSDKSALNEEEADSCIHRIQSAIDHVYSDQDPTGRRKLASIRPASSSLRLTVIVQATVSPGPGHANLGPIILRALAAEPSFNVSVLSRDSTDGTLPAGVDVPVLRIANDYPEAALVSAFQGFDAIVLTTGYATLAIEPRFVDAAAAAGVKRIILPQWGAPGSNAKVAAASPLFAAKGNLINHAREKEGTGLTWTAVACGIFFDMLLTPMVNFDLKQRTGTVWNDGAMMFSSSTKEQAARATIQILKKPTVSANRTVYISSFQTSHNDVLAKLESRTGVKWTRANTTTEETVRDATDAIKQGNLMKGLRLALLPYFAEGYDADYAAAGLLDNDKLELEQEDMNEVIGNALDSKE